MLRREDWRDNHKRIYRLYSEQGLSLRLKRPRRNKSAQRRKPQPQELYPDLCRPKLCSTEVAEMLKSDNGSKFAGKMLDKWVYERGLAYKKFSVDML